MHKPYKHTFMYHSILYQTHLNLWIMYALWCKTPWGWTQEVRNISEY